MMRRAVEAANVRRRVTLLAVITLMVLVVVNVASISGVGLLVLHARQDGKQDRARQANMQQVLTDVYGLLNDHTARLARIEGVAVPPTVPPPTTATTRPPAASSRPAATSDTTARSAATTTTTASHPGPPATTTTTTRPPPTTSTTARPTPTTTCTTVDGLSVCR